MRSLFIISSIMLSLSSASASANSAERCKVQAYASIFLENGRLLKKIRITDGRFVTRQKNWQDCYKFAQNEANTSLSYLPLEVSGERIEGGRQDATGYVYFKWTFDDGVFYDSQGMVTSYTDEFEAYPDKGDLRYFKDGTLFQ